jgi:hypothetical protein
MSECLNKWWRLWNFGEGKNIEIIAVFDDNTEQLTTGLFNRKSKHKRHSELVAIFLKKIEKKREYVTRIIQSLSVYDFISDERKIMTGIIRVRGYVAMFICKDLQT